MLITKQAQGVMRQHHRYVAIYQDPEHAILPAAAAGIGGSRLTGRGSALGFACAPWGCVCSGDDDCNDMFSTNVCGPWAVCSGNFCICSR